ncbi:MAG: acyl carrier protein [Actinobacteria bacterium]|uniref:Unannotated protein n=1 Tax=freshwater metagenome TaxID=449393 RepID=A0A6J7E4L8_9ZZZZ|nr:acyl carrier protein [Actinomycetota bacterium]
MNGHKAAGDAVRALVLDEVLRIAPDIEPSALDDTADLRRTADLDSLDFQTLIEAIAARTGVVVPEGDYQQVRSLQGMTDYISSRMG